MEQQETNFFYSCDDQYTLAGVSVRDIIADRIFGLLIWFIREGADKMKKTLVLILLVLAFLVVTSPAAAAQKVRVGEKISVFSSGSTTFPAGAPFHIAHGWTMLDSNLDGLGVWDFKLEVDGVPWKEDFVERSVESGDPDLHTRIWVFNFPEGMEGTHTFTGHWLGPCQVLVDDGTLPGPCSSPNEKVEALVRTLTVTFEP